MPCIKHEAARPEAARLEMKADEREERERARSGREFGKSRKLSYELNSGKIAPTGQNVNAGAIHDLTRAGVRY